MTVNSKKPSIAKQPQKPKARKRRENFGQIKALPSGRIHASYVGLDGNRHNAPMTYDNLTDARAWLAKQQTLINEGEWEASAVRGSETAKKSKALTLGVFAQEWVSTRVNRDGDFLRPRTSAEYQRLLSGALSPLLDYRLNAITPEVVRKWNSEQLSTGHKTQTSRAYSLLNSILKTAVEDQRITFNPCIIRGAQNASTGKKVEPPTLEELDIIVDAILPKYKALVLMAAWGAMRFGEITELRRGDIVFERNEDGSVDLITTRITRAVTQVPGQGFKVDVPKTKTSIRSVVMPPFINAEIISHLETFVAPAEDALLFPASDGVTHMNQSTLAKSWYPARAKAGRSDLPFHGLRHFGGTRYAQTGATLQEIQDRLGHATVSAAMRYQHSAGRDAELARKMSSMR